MHSSKWLWALFTVFAVLGVASADTDEKMSEELAKYQKYAGAPVEEFRLWKLHEFQLVGADRLVVWTAVNEAYLLEVEQPCSQLAYAKAIAVTSTLHTVSRKFDTVRFENQRCRIAEIRPIDYRRLQEDQKSGTK